MNEMVKAALTPAQKPVAELLLAGMSNRDRFVREEKTAQSPVVICPDLFVRQLSRYGRRYREAMAANGQPYIRRGHTVRRHGYKEARMCQTCIEGQHQNCQGGICSCVHHELAAQALLNCRDNFRELAAQP